MMGGPSEMMIKENVQPPKSNFTFQVIDYEKPETGATGQYANKNNSAHIQIGVIGQGLS